MKLKSLITAASAAVFLSACSGDHDAHNMHAEGEHIGERSFSAILNPTEGNEGLQGFVMFEDTPEGVFVLAHVEGLEPGGVHGFHVHEYGDCSAPDGTSAGGHFNPHGRDHGGPDSSERHAGDLGNLQADDAGMAHLEMIDTKLELSGPNSILGKSVIVHAQADDLESQPTGDAGARILCGVIADADVDEHHGH
ncbi:superoxide dismutase family protein [Aliidiomarina halalkaliphila]|uniref:Superoxide dismutase family protein n=1 Tax=Aliidiomarina halalkaliphila TaxID=2593535 RepID=A0A552X0Z9_9GAMM|nr:superoxide dismutase family protein [Aliidiomarina halalkaliphila]TRW48263.1 superoxide dismutase family protein [Aliidiomarina halalkaliphila]